MGAIQLEAIKVPHNLQFVPVRVMLTRDKASYSNGTEHTSRHIVANTIPAE